MAGFGLQGRETMPTTMQNAIAKKTAEGVIEGVDVAAPVAGDLAKQKARTVLHSRGARVSGVITGSLFFAIGYGMIARRRRLKRIEEKLDNVAGEVAD